MSKQPKIPDIRAVLRHDDGEPIVSADGKPFQKEWLGDAASMYDPAQWQRADAITLAGFRQILLWPLVLRLPLKVRQREDAIREAVDAACNRLSDDKANWKKIDDLLNHPLKPVDPDKPDERSYQYSEFVYFHDYVQSTLFRNGAQSSEIRLFQRRNVSAFSTLVDGVLFKADVARCNLYVLATGMAVLAVELDFGKEPKITTMPDVQQRALALSDAQNFIDKARRVYAPYFDRDSGLPQATPQRIDWFDAAGMRLDINLGWTKPAATMCPQSGFPSRLDMFPEPRIEHVREQFRLHDDDRTGKRSAPVAEAWRAILQPLVMRGYEDEDGLPGGQAAWRHVVDERIPCLSFISLTDKGIKAQPTVGVTDPNKDWGQKARQQRNDIASVSRGDWIRLCFADGPGSDPMPYNPEFLATFEKAHCYDRFWASDATDTTTRYMFAGYHTCVVGAGNYFDDTLVHHVRRHYFQMTLVTQIEFASLLGLSSRVTEAVVDYRRNRQPGAAQAAEAQETFQRTLQSIQRDFLEFVHLFRFTGLSNQIQAQELFARMRAALGLDALFADVKAELEAATSYVLAVDQQKQADASNRLSLIAVIGFVFSLVLAAAGANLFLDGETVKLLTQAPAATDGKPADAVVSGWGVFSFAYGRHLAIFGGLLAMFSSLGWWASRTLLGASYAKGARTAAQVLGWTAIVGLACIPAGLWLAGEHDLLSKTLLLIVLLITLGRFLFAWLDSRYAG